MYRKTNFLVNLYWDNKDSDSDSDSAVECKWAYMVPYYNLYICYYYHLEHLFLLSQITFNGYILMLCPLVVNLT